MKSYLKSKSPWAWIPTLYIAEGLPYFAVNTLTVILYTNLGVSLTEMAFFTGWLYLPWVVKPFWSPFIDLFSTKRKWVLAMQGGLAATMALIGILLFLSIADSLSFLFASTLAVFWIMAFFSATHDIAADGYYMLELTDHQQAAFVGVRSTFYRFSSIIGQGAVVYAAGWLEVSLNNVAKAWSIIFIALSLLFIIIFLWHEFAMPKTLNDHPVPGVTAKTILKDFADTFVTFFKKPHIFSALAFMLFYRLPEAFCIKLVQPFMLAPREIGGLALTTQQVGIINGTIGVVALLLGGILGGIAIARNGLKKWLWPMACALTLPCLFYCGLAMFQPENIYLISSAIFIEQFGYGFGFTAFMLYLIYFSQGPSKTSHYAFCTAFMALGMMIPGMFAGWIHEHTDTWHLFASTPHQGFINFFWWVMITSAATFVVCLRLKIDPKFGKKNI